MPDKIVVHEFSDGCEEYWYHLIDKRGTTVSFLTDEHTVKKELHAWFKKAVELGLDGIKTKVFKDYTGITKRTFFEPVKE